MSNNDYYNKYIKYKIKYLKLSNMKGGLARIARSAATFVAKNPELKSSLLNAAKSAAKSVKDDPNFQKELITAAANVANKNPKFKTRFQKAAKLVNDNPEIIKGFQTAAKLVHENKALEIVGTKVDPQYRYEKAENTVSHASAAQAASHASHAQAAQAASAAQAVSYDIVPPSKQLPPAQLPPAELPINLQEIVGNKICQDIFQITPPRTNLMISLNSICKLAK